MIQQPEPVAPLPFSHPLGVDRLARGAPLAISHRCDAAQAESVAAFLKVDAVEDLDFSGHLVPWQAKGWQIEGRLRARVRQACVVTLEPVTQTIDVTVERRFLPAADCVAADPNADFDPEEENAPDPHDGVIDLAAVMMEALVLAIDPYPRAAGASLGSRVFAPPGAEPLTDEAMRPFAGLAALRARTRDGNGGS